MTKRRSSDPRQQLRHRHSKSLREFIQVIQAEIPFGSFDATDVGSMETCLFGQGFLGPAPKCSKKTQPLGQDVAGGVRVWGR